MSSGSVSARAWLSRRAALVLARRVADGPARRLGPRSWLALGLGMPALAVAQSLPEVVVTATRLERPIAESLVDIRVIDAREIRESGSATLLELLRAHAGVEISQNGGAGSLSGLFMRGTKTSQSLVMVDGQRLENPTSGGANLEYLPLSMIERIEIVRGPASALYGSAAIGGVVQIFTRGADAPAVHAQAGLGTQASSQWQAGFSRAADDGRTRLSASVSQERTRGIEATRAGSPDYQADLDGHRRTALSAALAHRTSNDWQLAATVLASDGRNDYDDAFSKPADARIEYRSSALGLSARGRLSEAWSTELRAGQTGIDYRYKAFDYAPRTLSQSLLWMNSLGLPLGRLDLGLEQLRQRISGSGISDGDFAYQRTSRRTDSVFVAWEFATAAQRLRLQMRQDRIQSVGSEPTAALGWSWQWAPAWTLRASLASAFRAPTFDDLYNPFGSNPALRAERSRGADLALDHRGADGRSFRVTLFENRIRDAIELDGDFVPRNLARARVRGVSLEAGQRIAGIDLRANLTAQDAQGQRDDSTGPAETQRLARRARAFGQLSAQWRGGPLRLGAQWIVQGDRVDTRGERLAGYGIVDLSAGWQINPSLEWFSRLGNLGDRRYETAFGYNMPGRNFFTGVRYAMR